MSYRVGLIGCGGIARRHARAYLKDPRMELVACADPNGERLAGFSGEFGLAGRASAEEMLAGERLDIVSVCTPHRAHRGPVMAAAEAGVRAILCEKPIGMNLTEADEMIRACRERGVLMIVGHQRRFQPVYRALADPVRGGELGRVTAIQFEMPHWDLMTWGTHATDLIRFYIHDAPTVSVFGQVDISTVQERFGHKVEDSAVSYMLFENGTRATLVSGSVVELYHQRIIGEEGELFFEEIWGDPPKYTIRIRRNDEPAWREIPRPEDDDFQVGFDGEVRALGDCLQTGARHTLDCESGREALAIVMATYESARSRRVVEFPVDIPDNPLLAMLGEGKE